MVEALGATPDYDPIPFGGWVREQRKAAGFSQSELATAISLSHSSAKSTISGIESGRRRLDAGRRRTLVETLTKMLDQTDRPAPNAREGVLCREVGLRLAGLVAEAPLRALPISTSTDDRLINRAEYLIASASFMLYGAQPYPDLFLSEVADAYTQLAARSLRDPDIALKAAQVGEYVGRAQEVMLPWFERSDAGAASYSHALQFVVEPALNRYAHSSQLKRAKAQLLALRAPLYRELHHYQQSIHDAGVGLELATQLDDTVLQSDIARNIAHTLIVCGQEEHWKRALDRAADIVERDRALRGPERAIQDALLEYHRAEGFKRLAYNHRAELTWRERQAYAARALDRFAAAEQRLSTEWVHLTALGAGLSGQPLIIRVSMAQCLAWIHPQSAITDLNAIAVEAENSFRSLLPKIAYARYCARLIHDRMRASPRLDEVARGFDLDAHYVLGPRSSK